MVTPVAVRLKHVGPKLQKAHNDTGIPMADIIRQAVDLFLDAHSDGKKLMDAHMEYRRRNLLAHKK